MNVARTLPAALLALFAALACIELWQYLHLAGPVHSDFFGLWSWSRFLAAHGTAGLYDPAAQQAFQSGLDPAYADDYYPFLYPPTYLLVLWPLGHLPFGAARLLWSALTLAAFLAALAGPRWRTTAIAGTVAPATVLCLICGQNGLLTAALMLGGLRNAVSRPKLAGLLLGLLGIKPHLALLVPLALIAAGLWRALAATAVSAALAAALSASIFGAAAWHDWLAAGRTSWSTVQDFVGQHDSLVPTVSAALRQLGFGPHPALLGQLLATLVASLAVWVVWRTRRGAIRYLVLAVATLLATPYAYLYDLPMVSGAALLLLAECSPAAPVDAAFIASALLLPQLMFGLQGATLPLAAPVLALTLAWLLRPRPDAAPVLT